MRPFDYTRAHAPADAVGAEARIIAGGTNLLDLMKLQVETPDRLIDINHVGLDRVERDGDGLRIGALVRNSDLAADPAVREGWPLLSKAILAGASAQIRNRATTGGNLMQRTRCYYFYDIDAPCNKREPGSGCGAIGGNNRQHAILGASDHCIATYPGDMAVAMSALDAVIEVEGPAGKREIRAADFHRLPGDTPQRDNELQSGEMILSVRLPAPLGGRQIYRKVRDRRSYAFALVSVAAVVVMEAGRMATARLAFGGVAHKPWRVPAAESLLTGQPPSPELFDRAADAVLAGARGQGHNDFKIPLLRRTLGAVLAEATQESK
ncbi:xanthine dehydrogenase family protein subunit M [Paracoccus sp. Z118]|uniref:FAD binding domain-containing protein n=1 Tax=Paracoccus sp. Z118 TaxID=2851017 RepID=UPI001C2BF721|nr:xanthine dehydrogenase family protein subunit M [Paracoccus sp. Z118]MBV0891165.1 xanthine dehydrogenase family protein subunit M [Paracoccus sp. Z118]